MDFCSEYPNTVRRGRSSLPWLTPRRMKAHAIVGKTSGVSMFDTRIDLVDLVKMTGRSQIDF